MTKHTLTVHYDQHYTHDAEELVGVFGGLLNNFDNETESEINNLLGCNWRDLSREEFIQRMERSKEIAAFRPVYMYSHSGVTISTSPFYCPWDSGQIGWAVITRSQMAHLGCKRIGPVKGGKIIDGFINDYLDEIVQGNVYGFEIKDENGEHVDSCWGFVGSNVETNGMLEYLDEELHEQAKEIFDTYQFAA